MGNIPEPVPKTCPSPVATGGLASITGRTAVRGGRAGRGRPCLSQSEARGQRPEAVGANARARAEEVSPGLHLAAVLILVLVLGADVSLLSGLHSREAGLPLPGPLHVPHPLGHVLHPHAPRVKQTASCQSACLPVWLREASSSSQTPPSQVLMLPAPPAPPLLLPRGASLCPPCQSVRLR